MKRDKERYRWSCQVSACFAVIHDCVSTCKINVVVVFEPEDICSRDGHMERGHMLSCRSDLCSLAASIAGKDECVASRAFSSQADTQK